MQILFLLSYKEVFIYLWYIRFFVILFFTNFLVYYYIKIYRNSKIWVSQFFLWVLRFMKKIIYSKKDRGVLVIDFTFYKKNDYINIEISFWD